ncbi:uncharacterized protein BP5553_05603 [Venustampulla echinocandica]|uniref:Zn(2)-C6 fungal-type domain-containing protein n=1 Tax=Venustampulla echinocandica TaxID=2656787 RepID=A0A370TRL2_9HELO|nr:uncharacterized protein BP5553_05603 [Venustampulla echinocandica]RDL38170.1 hypothetical protein BP5553_05603 [Venustampulla echinocandica]
MISIRTSTPSTSISTSISTSTPTAPRRPPPRLRTKTGCFQCRKRRKKCDERKPFCTDCSKHGFRCVWPAPPTAIIRSEPQGHGPTLAAIEAPTNDDLDVLERRRAVDILFADDSTKIATTRSACYGLPGIRTSAEHYLSLYYRERYMPTLLRSHAHRGFANYSSLLVIGSQNSMIMNIFLATAATHAGWSNPRFKPLSIKYYNSVISSLRKAIDTQTVKGDEDWLLVVTNFLCLFEVGQGRIAATYNSGIVSHLAGLARILSIRSATDTRLKRSLKHPVLRTTAESFVHLSYTTAFYDSKADLLADLFSWDELQPYLEANRFSGARAFENSPLLGYNWRIYKTAFEVVRLSHKVPLNTVSSSRGQELDRELLEYDEEVRKDAETWGSDKRVKGLLQHTRMLISAARILALKTLRPETRASDPQIVQLVQDALATLRVVTINHEGTAYFCWPLAIISCAVSTEEDIAFLSQLLQNMWDRSQSGSVLCLKTAMETFWKSLEFRSSDDVKEVDGDKPNLFDVLVQGDGFMKHPLLKT